MYTVYIIDDEIVVVEMLKKLIDWENYGFKIIGEAKNGIEALEKMEACVPDLLVADIDMPKMDGIKLVKEIASRGYKTKVLLLTGYSDFNFAREAVNYGVTGYMLKPVDRTELLDNLLKIRKMLENRVLYEYTKNVVREGFFRSLAEGRENYRLLKESRQELEISFSDDDAFSIMIIEVENTYDSDNAAMDNEELFSRVSIAISGMKNEYASHYLFRDSHDRLCVISFSKYMEQYQKLLSQTAEEIRTMVAEITGLKVTVGVSSVSRGLQNVRNLFIEAVKSLDTMFLLGKNRVLSYNPVYFNMSSNESEKLREKANSLLQSIASADRDQSAVIVENILNEAVKLNIEQNYFKELIIELVVGISKAVRELNGDLAEVFGEEFDLVKHIMKRSSIFEIKGWLLSVVDHACSCIGSIKSRGSGNVVRDIINYIHENYATEITLKSLARKFYLNPLYLGQQFKRQTGEPFNSFLAHVRIENAIKLLKNSDMKVYEIAEHVGYKEIQYFYKVFKSVTGSSPSIYR